MQLMIDRRLNKYFFMIVSITSLLFTSLYASTYPDYFPPTLGVQHIGSGRLTLSALVCAKDGVTVPKFCADGEAFDPTILDSMFTPGWTLYRYLFTIPLAGSSVVWGTTTFTIPSFAQGLKCFYTSCADGQPGVSENWKKFYAYANKMKACVHLRGGDNIPYPDDGLDAIFHNDWPDRDITDEEKQQVTDLYLKLYLQALSELPKEGALIPTIAQRDDHDCYDGRGSLGDSENRSIPRFIRQVADSLFFRLQQHILESEKEKFCFFGGADNYSKLYQFQAGETLLQIDGRGERTRKQICSSESWEKIWSQLDNIQACKTLYVMLGVPIAFPAMPEAAKIVTLIQNHPFAAKLTEKFLGKNRDGSPEPLDDVYYDHWDEHVEERDMLIQKLQEFSMRTKAKVVLISGDVHSASTGVITREGKPTIYQVTSSAVGSIAPSRAAVAALDALNHLKSLTTRNRDNIHLVPSLFGPDGQSTTFIGERNGCIIDGNDVRLYDESGTEYKSTLLTPHFQKENAKKCCTAS